VREYEVCVGRHPSGETSENRDAEFIKQDGPRTGADEIDVYDGQHRATYEQCN
jgi:hypothetical protein